MHVLRQKAEHQRNSATDREEAPQVEPEVVQSSPEASEGNAESEHYLGKSQVAQKSVSRAQVASSREHSTNADQQKADRIAGQHDRGKATVCRYQYWEMILENHGENTCDNRQREQGSY